jgi:hypothetical protein
MEIQLHLKTVIEAKKQGLKELTFSSSIISYGLTTLEFSTLNSTVSYTCQQELDTPIYSSY